MSKRKQYGIYVDLIDGRIRKAKRERYCDVLAQVWNRNYEELDDKAEELYNNAMQYAAMYGSKYPVTLKGKRYHLLCTAKGAIFLTYQYQHVSSDVIACLKNGTPTWVFSPYKVPDMVKVTSLQQWYDMLNAERISNKQFYTSKEYQQWEQEVRYTLTSVLNTPVPWLDKKARLHTIVNSFSSFAEFLAHAEAIIAEIEAEGEWDIELTSSLVMNEKASTATYVASKGANKGMRTFWTNEAGTTEYWYNYEHLPADICTKFIHLTYLKSIGYKPLQRIVTDGVDYNGEEVWLGTALEDVVRATPLYVDPYSEKDEIIRLIAEESSVPVELQEVVDAMGLDTIKRLGYEEALKSIRYNLKNR